MDAPLTQVRVYFAPLGDSAAYSVSREQGGTLGLVWLATDLDRHQQAICLQHALDALEAPAGPGRYQQPPTED